MHFVEKNVNFYFIWNCAFSKKLKINETDETTNQSEAFTDKNKWRRAPKSTMDIGQFNSIRQREQKNRNHGR